jgi:hypothetical protein
MPWSARLRRLSVLAIAPLLMGCPVYVPGHTSISFTTQRDAADAEARSAIATRPPAPPFHTACGDWADAVLRRAGQATLCFRPPIARASAGDAPQTGSWHDEAVPSGCADLPGRPMRLGLRFAVTVDGAGPALAGTRATLRTHGLTMAADAEVQPRAGWPLPDGGFFALPLADSVSGRVLTLLFTFDVPCFVDPFTLHLTGPELGGAAGLAPVTYTPVRTTGSSQWRFIGE